MKKGYPLSKRRKQRRQFKRQMTALAELERSAGITDGHGLANATKLGVAHHITAVSDCDLPNDDNGSSGGVDASCPGSDIGTNKDVKTRALRPASVHQRVLDTVDRMVMSHGWPIPEAYRRAIIERQSALATDSTLSPKQQTLAAKAVISASEANVQLIKTAMALEELEHGTNGGKGSAHQHIHGPQVNVYIPENGRG